MRAGGCLFSSLTTFWAAKPPKVAKPHEPRPKFRQRWGHDGRLAKENIRRTQHLLKLCYIQNPKAYHLYP